MTDKEIIDGLYEIKNWKCNGDSKMHSIIRGAIDLLEQTRWIPVSKPPKKNGEYLVTLIDKDSDGDDIFVTDKAYWTGMNWTYKFLIVENVIAYKTLSEHFREEEENETNN